MNASRISNRKDITGNKYGRLTAISFVNKQISGAKFNDKIPYTKYLWLFKCDCGNEKTMNRNDIISGNVRSCGCLSIVHGYTKGGKAKPTYNVWRNFKAKCSNPNHYSYTEYGGRGVKVCERWLKFENFLEDIGERPEIGCQLDRIDNDGDYEPSNCKWSTANNRRRSILITYNGKTQSLKAWCDELGLVYSTVCAKRREGRWQIADEFIQ